MVLLNSYGHLGPGPTVVFFSSPETNFHRQTATPSIPPKCHAQSGMFPLSLCFLTFSVKPECPYEALSHSVWPSLIFMAFGCVLSYFTPFIFFHQRQLFEGKNYILHSWLLQSPEATSPPRNKPKHWSLIYLSSQSSYELKHYNSVLFFVNPAKRSGPRDTLFPFTLLLFSFLPC